MYVMIVPLPNTASRSKNHGSVGYDLEMEVLCYSSCGM
jgi:hypothetical protein